MSYELKPCPLCGSKAETVEIPEYDHRRFLIGCSECDFWSSDEFKNRDAQIAAWNTRTADTRADALAGLLREARPLVEEVTIRMPKWVSRERGPQDPLGAHGTLERIDAALGGK